MKNEKEILWSVLEKYDGDKKYESFCDSVSRFIQNQWTGDDLLTVYNHLLLLDIEDTRKIDLTLGNEINNALFCI